MKCAVANCKSANKSKACEVSFFFFPKDAVLQKKWLKFCGKGKNINPKTSHICMLHFNPDDFENNLQFEMGFAKKRFLKPGTVPSVKPASITSSKLADERASRCAKRENIFSYDGLENLTGYICHRLKEQEPNISVPRDALKDQPYTWVDHLSEGGLSKPTETTMCKMQALNKIFLSINKEGLLITKGFLKKHMELAQNIDCSEKVKTLFFRSRMYFKIRSLNGEIVESSKQRKRKIVKTLE